MSPRVTFVIIAGVLCLTSSLTTAGSNRDAPLIPDIETFMQIGYATKPGTGADGGPVLFETGLSGVDQLYRITDDGWPYQLTVFPDGMDFSSPAPSGTQTVIGASRGGDEQWQLYLMDTWTGAIRPLTEEPEVRHSSPVWSPDEKVIYFGSNEANGRDFYIYSMELSSGEKKLVYQHEGLNVVEDISSDGSQLAVLHYFSNANTDIYLVEVPSGEVTHLTPHDRDAVFHSSQFSADDKSLYLLSSYNRDSLVRVAKLNIATKEIRFLEEDSPWEVEELSLSPGGRYLAWVQNEDGFGNPRLRDLVENHDLPLPPLAGIVENMTMTRDGVLYFSYNSPVRTTDVWRWDWRVPELSRLTNSTYAGIDPSLFRAPELVKIRSFDGLEIPAFIFLPADRREGERIPFVIHIHGGPEAQYRPYFYRHFQYLMLNGYGILAPNVRGSSGYGQEYMMMDNYRKRLDSVKDVGAAAKWLIDEGYTDTDRLAVKGASYGGYMTLATLVEFPDLFAAGIDNVGIANFVTFLENTKAYRRHLREREYGPLTDREFLLEVSPLTHVDRIRAPLLVIHGENDPRVPVEEARQIVAALEERGQVAESLIFPDEGHSVAKLANRLVMYRQMVDFLDRHLKRDR